MSSTTIHLLQEICRARGIPTHLLDEGGFVLTISDQAGQSHLIIQNTFGLVSDGDAQLAKDKSFQAQFLQSANFQPYTRTYIDPQSPYALAQGLSLSAAKKDILQNFQLPIIMKKNSGSRGVHVFKVSRHQDILPTFHQIFNQQDKDYDHVAIVQPFLVARHEYRVIQFQGKLMFAYEKTFPKELKDEKVPLQLQSSLRWSERKADLITSVLLQERLQQFLDQFYQLWPLAYGGLDVLEDYTGQLWLVEVNTMPAFSYFIRDNGEEKVRQLLTTILEYLLKQKTR